MARIEITLISNNTLNKSVIDIFLIICYSVVRKNDNYQSTSPLPSPLLGRGIEEISSPIWERVRVR